MKILSLMFLSWIITFPAFAETINLASKQYVKDNCLTISKTENGTQTMAGDYTVSGTFNVPTPPLPPEE
ncbi:MAG: hypothetical protein II208_02910 [Alphaproteobacteria bacterium]|nr:hypothetical protein [Alphaproteobacteria bacterium]